MSTPLFRFEDVEVAFDERTVLHHINLDVADGGITAIVGPSGSGKSTLLRLCNRLVVPSHGRVLFRGRDVAELDVLAHRRQVGMVFQRPTMFPGTVRDNLLVADPQAPDEALRQVLERVALSAAYLDRTGDDLSGGEAQRACLARTLLCHPHVLLADEPTSALDTAATATLEERARDLADSGVPILWVTHNLRQADRLADHRVLLIDGHVADATETDAFLASWRDEEESLGTEAAPPEPTELQPSSPASSAESTTPERAAPEPARHGPAAGRTARPGSTTSDREEGGRG